MEPTGAARIHTPAKLQSHKRQYYTRYYQFVCGALVHLTIYFASYIAVSPVHAGFFSG